MAAMCKRDSRIKAAPAASRRSCAAVFAVLMMCLAVATAAGEPAEVAEAMGIRAYFGMVPAALMDQTLLPHGQGRQAWARNGPLPDAHHLLIALFDVTDSTRISDATVELVHLAPTGGGSTQKLDLVRIGDTTAYGGLIRLSVLGVHQFEIRVFRLGATRPVIFHYSYDARHPNTT